MRWEDVTDDVDALFCHADKNKDNRISLKELEKMFKQLGIKITSYDAKHIVKTFDKDNSGLIEIAEFRKLMKMVVETDKSYAEAWEAFHVIDTNDNMVISKSELRDVCKYLPIKLDEEDIHDMFKRIDKDSNGVINFDEFAKAYAFGIKHLNEGIGCEGDSSEATSSEATSGGEASGKATSSGAASG